MTADAYNCMGYEYYNIGEKSKAREYFEKAKALGNTYAVNNLKILDEVAAQEAEELRRQQEEKRQRIEAERQRRAEERKNNVNEFVGLLGELAEAFGGGFLHQVQIVRLIILIIHIIRELLHIVLLLKSGLMINVTCV